MTIESAGNTNSAIRRESVGTGDDVTGNNTNWERRSIRAPSMSMMNALGFSNNQLEPIRQILMTVNKIRYRKFMNKYNPRNPNRRAVEKIVASLKPLRCGQRSKPCTYQFHLAHLNASKSKCHLPMD